MNAQSAKSFLLCFAKDILQRKSVLLDIFQLILITTASREKNIYDKLRKQRIFCRE